MEENVTEEQQPTSKKIQASFHKLNPDFKLHASVMNEILYIGVQDNQSRAENQLHRNPSFPGMPIPKYASWRQECSLNTSAKETVAFKAATKKLYKTLQNVHQTTLAALVSNEYNISELEKFLITLIKAVDNADTKIENWKKDYPEWASKKSGQPKKKPHFTSLRFLPMNIIGQRAKNQRWHIVASD